MVKKLEARPWAASRQPFQVVPDDVRGRVEVVCGEWARDQVRAVLADVGAGLGDRAGEPRDTDSGLVLPLRAASKREREILVSATARKVKDLLGKTLVTPPEAVVRSGRR